MKKNLFLLFSLPLLLLAQAPIPSLLKDINTGAGSSIFGAFSAFPNNEIVFGINTFSSSTRGLWASNGSTVGTIQLKQLSSNINEFADYNNKKYIFGAGLGALWRTDGTIAGTDSIAIPEITGIYYPIVCNNLLFFVATSTISGTEIWRTDGTQAGTFLVKDIVPGAASSIQSLNPFKAVYNNKLFFIANDNISGQEIWTSDGTTAGTNLLSDIYPGTGTSNPNRFETGNNGVYFIANTANYGTELWFTDGTNANTQLIKDVNPGAGSATPSKLLFVGNDAYYYYGKTIYKSNGTSLGTSTLAISVPTSGTIYSQNIGGGALRVLNNEIYFPFTKITQMPMLLVTDTVYFCKTNLAITTQTILMKLEADGGPASLSFMVYEGLQVNNVHFIYHCVSGGGSNISLIFNPSTNAVRRYGNMSLSAVQQFTQQIVNNKLYYPFGPGTDMEPQYLDLANDSIFLIKNIDLNSSSLYCSGGAGSSAYVYQLNGYNYILAKEASYGWEFWQTDFTAAGTSLLIDINVGSGDYYYNNVFCNRIVGIVTANNIFFAANNGFNGTELWSFVQNPGVPNSIDNYSDKANHVSFFPNPTRERLMIQSKKNMDGIQVFNALGALVKDITPFNKNEEQLDLSSLKAGIYFVTVKTDAGNITEKIIKAE